MNLIDKFKKGKIIINKRLNIMANINWKNKEDSMDDANRIFEKLYTFGDATSIPMKTKILNNSEIYNLLFIFYEKWKEIWEYFFAC